MFKSQMKRIATELDPKRGGSGGRTGTLQVDADGTTLYHTAMDCCKRLTELEEAFKDEDPAKALAAAKEAFTRDTPKPAKEKPPAAKKKKTKKAQS